MWEQGCNTLIKQTAIPFGNLGRLNRVLAFTCFLIEIPVSLTTSTCSELFLILFSGLCVGFSTKDQMLKIYVATVLRHITEIIPLDRTKKESKGQFRV